MRCGSGRPPGPVRAAPPSAGHPPVWRSSWKSTTCTPNATACGWRAGPSTRTSPGDPRACRISGSSTRTGTTCDSPHVPADRLRGIGARPPAATGPLALVQTKYPNHAEPRCKHRTRPWTRPLPGRRLGAMTLRTFVGRIERPDDGPGHAIAVPFDPARVFGRARAPVLVVIGDHPAFRTTLASYGGHAWIGLRKAQLSEFGLETGA